MTCQAVGCSRSVMTSSCGAKYAYCEACTRNILSAAFAPDPRPREPRSWHERARAGTLPTSIVGGVPVASSGAVPGVEASPRLGHPQSAGAPVIETPLKGPGARSPWVSAVQRADALAGGSSASDPAASGRVIARATPGPAAPAPRRDPAADVVTRPASGSSTGQGVHRGAKAPPAGPSPR